MGSRDHLVLPFGYRKIQVAESCRKWWCCECKSNFSSNMNHIVQDVFAETWHRLWNAARARFKKRSINSPMCNFLRKNRNLRAVSKRMEKWVTFQPLSRMKQIIRIPRNIGITCLCQAVVHGNRLLHLLYWVTAFKIIIQLLASLPKRAFCFLITVEIAIRHNRATFNSIKLVNVTSHRSVQLYF